MIDTDRLLQLEDLAAAVHSGALSRSGFGEAMAELVGQLATLIQEFQVADLPEESAELLGPELALGAEGLDLVRQGLEQMSLYADAGRDEDLAEGLDLARGGLDQVAQVAALLRATRQNLERRVREGSPPG